MGGLFFNAFSFSFFLAVKTLLRALFYFHACSVQELGLLSTGLTSTLAAKGGWRGPRGFSDVFLIAVD